MKPSELLRNGAEEIKRRGWTRDWFGDDVDRPENCRVCAIGGLRAAITGDPFQSSTNNPLFMESRWFLIQQTGPHQGVVSWNDANGRTQGDVVELFEKAAVSAEAAGR